MTFECNQKMTFECKGLEDRVNDIESSITDLNNEKLDKTAVVQETGTGTDVVMSQKAVTDAIAASSGKGLDTLTDVNLTLGDTTVQYDTTNGIQINSTARFIDAAGNHDAAMDLALPIVAGDNVTIDKASTGEQVVVSSKYPNVITLSGSKLTDAQAALAVANPETTIFKKNAQCYFPLNPYNHNGKLSGKYVCLENLQVTNPPRWVINLLTFTDNAFTIVSKDVQMEAFINLYSKSGTLTTDQYNIIKEQNAVINLGDGENNSTTYVHSGFISGDGYIYTVAGVTGTAVPKNSAIRIHIDKTYEVIDQPDVSGGVQFVELTAGQTLTTEQLDILKANKSNQIVYTDGSETYYFKMAVDPHNGEYLYESFNDSTVTLGVNLVKGTAAFSKVSAGLDTIKKGTGQFSEVFNCDPNNANTASGDYSHAEGYITHATENFSHAEGYGTYATGYRSHAEGYSAHATGDSSHAEGFNTAATNDNSHAEGFYNIDPMPKGLLHVVGIGTLLDRRDGFEVYKTGEVWCEGPLYIGGDSHTLDKTTSKEVATKEYVDSKIPSGGGGVTSLDGQTGALTTKTVNGESLLGSGNIEITASGVTSLNGETGALTTKTLFGNQAITGTGNIDLYRHRITIEDAGRYKVVLTYVSSNALNVDSMTDLKTLIKEEGWFECAVVSPDPVFAFYINPQTLAIKYYKYNTSSEILTTTGALGGTLTDSVTTI